MFMDWQSNFVKGIILVKVMHRLSAILTKIPMVYFIAQGGMCPKIHVEIQKTYNN